ncbi:hypothetical protein ABTY96_43010 [Streptomyces sp. NPDC096057]|uniref:hypothetical protein n=1 Tax=Streptomyces sp. NPDC096057 TaxID=3155543 RepID=UPI00332BAFF4
MSHARIGEALHTLVLAAEPPQLLDHSYAPTAPAAATEILVREDFAALVWCASGTGSPTAR